MWEAITKGFKMIAAGGAQRQLGMQSPHTPGAIVRVGRFLYMSSGIWIAVSWYVGYANARTPSGGGPHLVLPGTPATNSVDRASVQPAFATATGSSNPLGFPTKAGSLKITGGASGGAARIGAARIAMAQVGKSGYEYQNVRPIPRSLNTRPWIGDCSGFVTDVYKAVGAADPNNLGYNGQGNTDTLQQNGTPVQRPNVGDLAFWSNPDHVAIVVGSGSNPAIVEFGAGPSPIQTVMSTEAPYHNSFIGFRSYL